MSSSTALLPKDRKQKDDHPIFLRACHSPWKSIGQKSLASLRGITAAYTVAAFGLNMHYEFKHNNDKWFAPFEFSNVATGLQMIYHSIAFTWTYMHLNYAHPESQSSGLNKHIQKMLSPPKQKDKTGNKHFFSIFNYAAQSFPLLSTFVFWAILAPKGKTQMSYHQMFHEDWPSTLFVTSKYIASPLVSVFEVFVLSSILRPDPRWTNTTGISTLSAGYLAWAQAGYVAYDKYAYYFLDHKEVGWEYVTGSMATFIAGANISLGAVYLLTMARERLATQYGRDSKGYQSLPQ